ncbi:MAG: HNH endonuclease [Patescibacteria group bacterium]|nr:HNH endonuclease [Patescibacteria group bacterium]
MKRFDQRDKDYRRLYKLSRWRKQRELLLSENPFCQICKIRPASEIDHIKPRKKGDDLPTDLDINNLQCLCRRCHSRKTMNEVRGSGRLPNSVKIHRVILTENPV